MLDYLKKFTDLPAELRQRIANQVAIVKIEELEKKYQLALAPLIMRVMVKEIALADLRSFLLKENLAEDAAGRLAEELKEKIFFSLGDYLFPTVLPAAPLSIQPGRPRPSQPSEPARGPDFLFPEAPPSPPKPPAQAVKPSEPPLVKGASFFFSPDDEQEIRELARKITVAEKTELPAAKIEVELAAIINRAQINFGSADLAERFKQILKTYFRGIRNKLEAELTLIKPFSKGGLSFDKDSAQQVMSMADKILNSKSDSPAGPADSSRPGQAGQIGSASGLKKGVAELTKRQGKEPVPMRDTLYDFSKLTKEKKASMPGGASVHSARPEARAWAGQPPAGDLRPELAPLTPVIIAVKPRPAAPRAKDSQPPAKIENKISSSSQGAAGANQTPLIRLRFQAENLSQNQKLKVEDVKYIPRVMSPLDELKYLDLVNFRRLDKDPLRAADKIKNKISLLEEEGYGKKLAGIRRWRSSPINKLYLAIGHFSISENRPVDVIIEERKSQAQDYLTAAEFKAIMDLNKSLRF